MCCDCFFCGDGKFLMNKKIGRNDPCPYGGGKKYKNVVLTKI